jgi:hypothetical protein
MAQKKDVKEIQELKVRLERLKEENTLMHSKLIEKVK